MFHFFFKIKWLIPLCIKYIFSHFLYITNSIREINDVSDYVISTQTDTHIYVFFCVSVLVFKVESGRMSEYFNEVPRKYKIHNPVIWTEY